MHAENSEISRLEQANTLGLSYLRTIVTLNGGAILAVLTFIANANSDAVMQFQLESIKAALWAFLVGIISMLIALLVSYSFTATAPEFRYHQFWNKRIVPFNSVSAPLSLLSFFIGVSLLICGAQTNS